MKNNIFIAFIAFFYLSSWLPIYNQKLPGITYAEKNVNIIDSFEIGKKLFRSNCAACHPRNMIKDRVGPALAGVAERWKSYPKEDLYDFIKNSQKMIEAGHPKAVELWQVWKPTIMKDFSDMSNEKIEAILFYIQEVERGRK